VIWRLNETGNVGDRLKEASCINLSLSVLGRCLEAVLHNQKPRSNNKLVSTVEFLEENRNVLNFDSITCKIATKKAETKKYSASTRYSYFMKNVVISPEVISPAGRREVSDAISMQTMY
jgi:hypothetical protein